MTDLSENDVLSEDNEVSNTDTQEQSNVETVSESDAEIDAINEVMAEENESEVIAENTTTDESVKNTDRLETDSGTVAKNETVEESDEQFDNPEQLEEPSEPEPPHNPWDDAPSDCYFYDKTYEDGHLGSYTESAETAYKMGWDIEHNYIPIADTEKSDVNGWTYPKDVCPHKSERDLQIEVWNREIFELKEELNATDYKAIKYAEGVLTDEEYQPTGIQRQAWRHRINELEELIKA